MVAILLGSGCRSNQPLVADTPSIQVGRAIGSDNRIGQHTVTFRPDDTIYVSVLTKDTGSGTIGVRWLYGERVVSEPSKQVSYKGAAATEFHIQNSGGFPEGKYSVEAFIDGQSVGQRNFTVARPE
jgi:subtilase family serine protease